MDLYMKGCAAAMVSVVLILSLGNKGKEFGILLGILVCALLAMVAMEYLKPVIDFLSELEAAGGLNSGMLEILLKISGIGIVSEIAVLVCGDSGNASLGKALQLMGSAVILWLSLPTFQMLLELIVNILGGI